MVGRDDLHKKNEQLLSEQKELEGSMNSLETLLGTLKQNHFLAEKLKARNEVLKIREENKKKLG